MPKGISEIDPIIFQRFQDVVERSLPFSLAVNKNFTKFSDLIYTNTSQYVSVSTLRRVFQYENNTSPSLFTLNTICQAIGYNSWKDFEEKETQMAECEFAEMILTINCQGYADWDQFLLIFNKFVNTPNIHKVAMALFNAAMQQNDINALSKFYDLFDFLKDIEPDGKEYYFHMELGMLLMQSSIIYQLIPYYAQHPVAQIYLVEYFVAEDKLNGAYGALLDEYHKHKKTPEAELFYYSLMYQKRLENYESVQEPYNYLVNFKETESVNPIHKIRRLAMLVIHFSGDKLMVDNLMQEVKAIMMTGDDRLISFASLLFCKLVFLKRLLHPIKQMLELTNLYYKSLNIDISVHRNFNYLKIYEAYILLTDGDAGAAKLKLNSFNNLYFCPYSFKRYKIHFDIVNRMIASDLANKPRLMY